MEINQKRDALIEQLRDQLRRKEDETRQMDALKQNLTGRIQGLQIQNDQLQIQNDQLQTELRRLGGDEKQKLSETTSNLRHELSKSQTMNVNLKDANKILRERKEEAERKASKLKQDLFQMQSQPGIQNGGESKPQIADLQRENARLRGQLSEVDRENCSLLRIKNEKEKFEAGFLQLQVKYDEQQKKLENEEKVKNMLKKDVGIAQEAHRSLVRKYKLDLHDHREKQLQDISSRQKAIYAREKDITKREEEVEMLEKEKEDIKRERKDMSNARNLYNEERRKWEDERNKMLMKHSELSNEYSELNTKYKLAEKEIASLKRKHDSRKYSSGEIDSHKWDSRRHGDDTRHPYSENSAIGQHDIGRERRGERHWSEDTYREYDRRDGPTHTSEYRYSTERPSRSRSSRGFERESSRQRSRGSSESELFFQQTFMIAQLQTDIADLRNELRFMKDENTHYKRTARELNTSLQTSNVDDMLQVRIAEQLRNMLLYSRKAPSMQSDASGEIPPSDYPPIAPFKKSQEPLSTSSSSTVTPSSTMSENSEISDCPRYPLNPLDKNLTCPFCDEVFHDGELLRCQKHCERCPKRYNE